MVDINLSSGGLQQQGQEKKGWGWMIRLEIILIVLIIGGFAFLIFDISNLDKKIAATKSDYEAQVAILKGESARNVFDFQSRMDESDKLLSGNIDSKAILQEVEKTIIPEIYLSSLKFDTAKKEIALVCVAKNFEQVARQIASFKKTSYFLGVAAGESEITEKGEIEFPVSLSVSIK